ncbi:MAG: SusC/RagA family TonB-linked outer membrane protein [Bacteroidetes bacterium]|jgi:TonB-linked SusC/RagA family outer membrane protein|nr:SusC/RagA family TonB-linked outer membrane protein [Bacteroidota bacterium]
MRYIFILAALIIGSLTGYSQTKTISGRVLDQDSIPLPGVNVLVKGTTQGVITDLEGAFTIEATSTDTLLFSFVGMQQRQVLVGEKTTMNIFLQPDYYSMDEVVVTALGIKKSSKALGYSVSQVNSEEISESQDKAFLNSLQGKIAGINVSSASGSPGASTRIIVRGITSLGGSNQPLFVVDGVPISNSFTGSASINGGTDFGNKANDINPDDIESVTVLKGAAATVKYGSRAANGVVEIITKKGRGADQQKPFLTFSSSALYEEPLRLIDYQNVFGQGLFGNAVSSENTSWGPQFDGTLRPWGNVVDDRIQMKAYEALPSNVADFFETGTSYTNSITLSDGNEQMTYYMSYSNVSADGIFPTNGDGYSRHTLSLRSSNEFTPRFQSTVSLNYVRKDSRFVPTGQGGQSVYNQVMQTPRGISLVDLEDLDKDFNNLDNYYSLFTLNPYYVLKKNSNQHQEDRLYGSLQLNYKLFEGARFQWRLGGDVSNEQLQSSQAKAIPEGNNEFSAIFVPGQVARSSIFRQQLSGDWLFTYDKKIRKWEFNGLLGYNITENRARSVSAQVNALTLDNFPNLANASESPIAGESESRKRLVGAFASMDVGYNDFLFLTLTARNDWSSTLPVDNNAFFYPGANAGIIFTELIPSVKKILPYGKIRLGWARVGKDAPVYSIDPVFTQTAHSDGFGFFSFPAAGINAYSVGNSFGNAELQPEITDEYEIGTDLRFFSNRVGIDFTYYNNIVTDQIWPVPIASSSGYTFSVRNMGKIENTGFEILLNVTPIKKRNFQWDMSFNFAKNDNVILELAQGLDRIVLNQLTVEGGQQLFYVAKPGRAIGIFEGRTVLRNHEGKVIVDNNGLPRATEELVEYGNSNYDFIAGMRQNFRWNGFTLGMTFDWRQGGMMYSQTKSVSAFAGTIPETIYNMRAPFIIPDAVVEIGEDAYGDPVYMDNSIVLDDNQLVNYWNNGGMQIDGFPLIDKTFIKLREVSLFYQFPAQTTEKIRMNGLSLGITARNVWLWTPGSQPHIDPEVTTFGNDLGADFGEYGAQPSTRSIALSLRLKI